MLERLAFTAAYHHLHANTPKVSNGKDKERSEAVLSLCAVEARVKGDWLGLHCRLVPPCNLHKHPSSQPPPQSPQCCSLNQHLPELTPPVTVASNHAILNLCLLPDTAAQQPSKNKAPCCLPCFPFPSFLFLFKFDLSLGMWKSRSNASCFVWKVGRADYRSLPFGLEVMVRWKMLSGCK